MQQLDGEINLYKTKWSETGWYSVSIAALIAANKGACAHRDRRDSGCLFAGTRKRGRLIDRHNSVNPLRMMTCRLLSGAWNYGYPFSRKENWRGCGRHGKPNSSRDWVSQTVGNRFRRRRTTPGRSCHVFWAWSQRKVGAFSPSDS